MRAGGGVGGKETEENERPECKRDEFICLVAFSYDSEAIDRAKDAGEAGAVCIILVGNMKKGIRKKCWGGLTRYPSQRLQRCRAFS